ncbi:Zn-dependent hydrolase [Leptolyngbya sp. FACHB-321]|uniref:Zn-dependent hydrolase n=1 Tax=Leptolyngbya sp. FACHB-321 TaxID=2692807 RepID=UPI001685B752|nr:Zn-dependent hydrolase [Leptolyngbya sp. FACHB-321]
MLMPVLSKLTVNGDRLNRTLWQLAEIGKLPDGGVSRLAFSADDLLARQQVQAWMIEAGMTVRVDAAGNIIGSYAGRYQGAAALATGSHIDTVPIAGRYDGCLGVLAGIEVVRVLHEQNTRLNHPLEVIVFTDEERSVLGCKAMAGEVKEPPEYYARLDGSPIQECLQRIGGDWSKISTAQRTRSELAAFVELHVEQGGVLEHQAVPIGVVDGIVGQYRFAVNVMGRMNHAGTTPMHLRKDALVAAAQMVLAVNKVGVEIPGDQVATVGYLNVSPNATNTVPGNVDFRIDLRDLSQEHLELLVNRLKDEFAAIATATQTEFTLRETLHILPTIAAPHIKEVIKQVSEQLALPYICLPSRAGHDAQEIGRFTDMGMIFVPSQNGISHSIDEYTTPEQCAQGANVLLHTFLQLDQAYPINETAING